MLSKSSNITEWVTLLNKRKKVYKTLKELIKSKDINLKTDKESFTWADKESFTWADITEWVYLNYNISEWCS